MKERARERTEIEGLETVQDQMMEAAHELTRVEAHLRRLEDRIELDDDVGAMVEGILPTSLAVALHGYLETAIESVEEAAKAARAGGLETPERLRREFAKKASRAEA